MLIGQSKIDFSQLLESPIRKTNQSYVRVYDAYIPVDELNENSQPIKKIAEIRTIVYLEDLGPKGEEGEGLEEEYLEDFKVKGGFDKESLLPEVNKEAEKVKYLFLYKNIFYLK